MKNIDNRLNECLNNMDINKKYQLLEIMEQKHFGKNEKADADFMDAILNLALEATTIFAKIFHII